jgi:16S rRNA (guanine966-N2)-methyltransferase
MNDGTCRIIGGRWRGRKIHFEDAEGLRPSTDRIRETLFNWLQAYVAGSHCLDCFAGSGVLGFEALSRGAGDVVFIELNRRTAEKLTQNCRALDADAEILNQDFLVWLQGSNRSDKQFDLVFLDPPFRSGLLEESCRRLNESGCLSEDAIIYVEQAIGEQAVMPENWVCLKQKAAGQVSFKLYQLERV